MQADPGSRRAEASRTAGRLLLIAVVALLFSWPLLVDGVPDLASDSVYHTRWASSFGGQLWAGEWYPRWLSDANGGLGAPAFFFYPPLPSYAAGMFRPWLAARDPTARLQVGFGCALALVLSGLAAYFWLRSLASPDAALFGAALYVVAPYHIAIDLYNRGAVAEFWTFVWMPLILLAVRSLIGRSRWAFPALSCAYALLVFTHLGIALCFSALPLAAAFFLSPSGDRVRTLATTAAAMLLGAGLAAVFLLPALLDQSKAHLELLLSGFGDYRRWFLFQPLPSWIHYQARILILTLSALAYALGSFWMCLSSRPPLRQRSASTFYLGAAVVAFFLMTPASGLLWRFVPYLWFLQFPSRFNTVLTVAAAALATLAFSQVRRFRPRWWLGLTALILLGWVAADAWAASRAFSVWRSAPAELTRLDPLRREVAEYWPRDSRPEIRQAPRLEEFLAAHPARSVELTSLDGGRAIGTASVASWRPREILVNINSPEDARLTVNHFYYPGWQARIGASATPIPAGSTRPDGLIRIDLPRGRYSLTLELARQGPESAGIAISTLSLAVLLGFVAVTLNARRPGRTLRNTT